MSQTSLGHSLSSSRQLFSQEIPADSSMKDMTPDRQTVQGQLSLRIDTTYPNSTPAYFRHVTPDQTLQEQMQVISCLPGYISCPSVKCMKEYGTHALVEGMPLFASAHFWNPYIF